MAAVIAATGGMSYANDPSCDLYAACGTGGDYFRHRLAGDSVRARYLTYLLTLTRA
jgi:hypothetical protein